MSCVRAPQCRAFATSRRISASRRSRACRNSRVARWGLTFLTYYRVGGGLTSFGPELGAHARQVDHAADGFADVRLDLEVPTVPSGMGDGEEELAQARAIDELKLCEVEAHAVAVLFERYETDMKDVDHREIQLAGDRESQRPVAVDTFVDSELRFAARSERSSRRPVTAR
jgi:hypothetical protein